MRLNAGVRTRLGFSLGLASLVSIGLFVAGAISNHSTEFAYLIWNLFLAWVPLALTLLLERVLRTRLWSSWLALMVTLLWVGFLPNSFYMISDFIHIQEVQRVDLLYDVVMFSSFIFTSVLLGFLSLYIVHQQLLKRMRQVSAGVLIGFVLVLCTLAIYLGRELRWNTWDVLVNPAGILVDISNRALDPSTYPQVATTVLSFLAVLGSLYIVTRSVAAALHLEEAQAEAKLRGVVAKRQGRPSSGSRPSKRGAGKQDAKRATA